MTTQKPRSERRKDIKSYRYHVGGDDHRGEQIAKLCDLYEAEIASLENALREIATHPHCSYYDPDTGHAPWPDRQYQIGYVDGHRCAAEVARRALGETTI
jgi:hypothetical protein